MPHEKSHPSLVPLLRGGPARPGRREFLQASCSLFGLALAACNSALPGEYTTVKIISTGATSLDFDVSLPEYSALSAVGGMVGVDVGSTKLLLIRAAANSVATFSRLCPHAQADLAPDQEGSYDAPTSTITCHLHNSKFDATGACTSGPAQGKSLKVYATTFDASAGKGSVTL